jgi:glyoxylase-like metal-dependent hydrolase (beta-lactamase superfamily II)
MADLMKAPESGVTVRMYRQGLGDCFLLAFPGSEGRPFYLLIDCGLLIGSNVERLRQVAAHIAATTGGRIDVLVATHEHWDHLSAFEKARETFDGIEIGEVWVAWTEDPEDPLANRLRAKRRAVVQALHGAVQHLRADGRADDADDLDPILGFFGELGANGKPSAIERAMDYVVARGQPPRFRTPGEAFALPGIPGVRVYVLGPPRDEKLLLRSDPSKRASEVYEKRLALDEDAAFVAALHGLGANGGTDGDPEGTELAQLSHPFGKVFRVDPAAAKKDAFFQKHYYGGPSRRPKDVPFEEELAWRRIETDWLNGAGSLALKLDSDTNNTSLALAFELVESGRVLLFPADAQVGNWLSWHTQSWKDAEGRKVTAEDLLKRTVLYKVGHHASHNATLREKGLEMMTSPDLVALIPVDEAMARKPKGSSPKGWDMPFPPLLEDLEKRTRGRVIRVDHGLPKRPRKASREEWEEGFQDLCDEQDLYVEITVPAGPAK